MTEVRTASRAKLTSLSSANGTDIYGINSKGKVVRLNPNSGDWHSRRRSRRERYSLSPTASSSSPRTRARRPSCGEYGHLMMWCRTVPCSRFWTRRANSGGRPDLFHGRQWSCRNKAKDSHLLAQSSFPIAWSRFRQRRVGIGFMSRWSPTAALRSSTDTPRAARRISFSGASHRLRMDALGRVSARAYSRQDSAWVIAIGTNHRLVVPLPQEWDTDLPAIVPDGSLALLGQTDVSMVIQRS